MWKRSFQGEEVKRKISQISSHGTTRSTIFRRTKRETEQLVSFRPMYQMVEMSTILKVVGVAFNSKSSLDSARGIGERKWPEVRWTTLQPWRVRVRVGARAQGGWGIDRRAARGQTKKTNILLPIVRERASKVEMQKLSVILQPGSLPGYSNWRWLASHREEAERKREEVEHEREVVCYYIAGIPQAMVASVIRIP
ncbi:hypothetical protein DVH24_010254 [Malus domestica]|uniref:Uncharacterized protein n=1 Tax=Malus domestica TaxID=3750 RepID=A0A498JPR0_MALDO|nr:hypothetical protein DVH24_010254 [Malus domestica]